MYADPFVCDNDNTGAVATRTYNRISFPTGMSSLLKNQDADDGTKPEVMKVSHQVVGSGNATRDRHMVRFEASSVDDGAIGTHTPVVVYAVFDIPRSYRAENIEYTLARQLVGFIRGANAEDTSPDYTTNFAKLLNGEL